MAIVTQPLGSSNARGSVGGLTYSQWRGRHTVRTRTGPSREPTPDQQRIIDLTVKYAQHWNVITEAQRTAWRTFAANQRDPHWTGQDKRLTGQQWWIRCNVRLDLNCGGYTPWPPTAPINDYLTNLQLDSIGDDVAISWDDPQGHGSWEAWVEWWLTKPLSPGRRPTIHDADRIGSTDISDQAAEILGLPDGTYTLFWRIVDDFGQATPFNSTRFKIPK